MNNPTTSTQSFVPWSEGAQILGLKRSAFFYLVKSGQIRAEEGRGPRDGRYSLEDIEELKQRRLGGKPRKTPKPYKKRPTPALIDWLSSRDIPAILRLDQIVYDEIFLAEMEVYRQWSEKNPYLAMAAFDPKSDRQVMLAYVAALPLDELVIFLCYVASVKRRISRSKRCKHMIDQAHIPCSPIVRSVSLNTLIC